MHSPSGVPEAASQDRLPAREQLEAICSVWIRSETPPDENAILCLIDDLTQPGKGRVRLDPTIFVGRTRLRVFQTTQLVVDVGDEALRVHRDQALDRGFNQAAQVGLLLAKLLFEPNTVGDVARGGKYSLRLAFGIAVHRRVERHMQQAP